MTRNRIRQREKLGPALLEAVVEGDEPLSRQRPARRWRGGHPPAAASPCCSARCRERFTPARRRTAASFSGSASAQTAGTALGTASNPAARMAEDVQGFCAARWSGPAGYLRGRAFLPQRRRSSRLPATQGLPTLLGVPAPLNGPAAGQGADGALSQPRVRSAAGRLMPAVLAEARWVGRQGEKRAAVSLALRVGCGPAATRGARCRASVGAGRLQSREALRPGNVTPADNALLEAAGSALLLTGPLGERARSSVVDGSPQRAGVPVPGGEAACPNPPSGTPSRGGR